jgi:hypothetical protein
VGGGGDRRCRRRGRALQTADGAGGEHLGGGRRRGGHRRGRRGGRRDRHRLGLDPRRRRRLRARILGICEDATSSGELTTNYFSFFSCNFAVQI